MDWMAPAAFCMAAFALATLACFGRAGSKLDSMERHTATMEWQLTAVRRDVAQIKAQNPFAHLLGKTVEYKKFEASDWQRGVVWCVGINGGLCIRDAEYLDVPGKWIHSDEVSRRVREVE